MGPCVLRCWFVLIAYNKLLRVRGFIKLLIFLVEVWLLHFLARTTLSQQLMTLYLGNLGYLVLGKVVLTSHSFAWLDPVQPNWRSSLLWSLAIEVVWKTSWKTWLLAQLLLNFSVRGFVVVVSLSRLSQFKLPISLNRTFRIIGGILVLSWLFHQHKLLVWRLRIICDSYVLIDRTLNLVELVPLLYVWLGLECKWSCDVIMSISHSIGFQTACLSWVKLV